MLTLHGHSSCQGSRRRMLFIPLARLTPLTPLTPLNLCCIQGRQRCAATLARWRPADGLRGGHPWSNDPQLWAWQGGAAGEDDLGGWPLGLKPQAGHPQSDDLQLLTQQSSAAGEDDYGVWPQGPKPQAGHPWSDDPPLWTWQGGAAGENSAANTRLKSAGCLCCCSDR